MITLEEAQQRSAERIYPRVTKESIEARIKLVRYMVDKPLTVCIIEMQNGFRVIGKAAPADERNYDQDVGQRYAYEDAFKQIWQFEGYLLCERLTSEPKTLQVVKDPQ